MDGPFIAVFGAGWAVHTRGVRRPQGSGAAAAGDCARNWLSESDLRNESPPTRMTRPGAIWLAAS